MGMSTDEFPCPSCQRVNAVDRDAAGEVAPCPRCGCELAMLVLIRESAAARTRRAGAALVSGFPTETSLLAAQSWALKPGMEAAACGLLADVMRGDLASASFWKQRLDAADLD